MQRHSDDFFFIFFFDESAIGFQTCIHSNKRNTLKIVRRSILMFTCKMVDMLRKVIFEEERDGCYFNGWVTGMSVIEL